MMFKDIQRFLLILFIVLFSQIDQKACARGKLSKLLEVGNVDLPEDEVDELQRSMLQHISDSTEYAIELGIRALKLCIDQHLPDKAAMIKLDLARAYREHDIYNQAYLMAIEASEYFSEVKDTLSNALALQEIGWIYYDIDNGALAVSFHKQALKLYEELKIEFKICYTFNAIGLSYLVTEEFEKALLSFDQSLFLANKLNNPDRKMACYLNSGLAFIYLNMFQDAETSLKRAKQVYLSMEKDVKSEVLLLMQFANLNISIEQYDKATEYLNTSENLLLEIPVVARKELLRWIYHYRYKIYEKKGEYKKALHFMIKHDAVKDEVSSMDYSRQLVEIRAITEAKKKDKEIIELENERKLKAVQRNMLVVGCVSILIIAFLLIIRLKGNQKRELQISEISKLLVQKELENALLEKENLNAKLNFKNTEFTNLALRVSQSNEQLQVFLDELKQLDGKTPFSNHAFKEILMRFKSVQSNNKEGEELILSLENEYKDFIFNLLQKYPDLTVHEQRLCAQFRLNLSNKDIANINNVSVKSVRMSRYRLRKAFNIASEENLMEFLRKF